MRNIGVYPPVFLREMFLFGLTKENKPKGDIVMAKRSSAAGLGVCLTLGVLGGCGSTLGGTDKSAEVVGS